MNLRHPVTWQGLARSETPAIRPDRGCFFCATIDFATEGSTRVVAEHLAGQKHSIEKNCQLDEFVTGKVVVDHADGSTGNGLPPLSQMSVKVLMIWQNKLNGTGTFRNA